MKTKGTERTKLKAPPRRTCEIKRSEKDAGTSARQSTPRSGLNQLEYEALSLLGDERVVRQDRFPLLLGITPAEVSTILTRLRRLGLIERNRILVEDPAPWVWLTYVGAQAAHLTEGMRYEPPKNLLKHYDAVVRARIAYMRKHPKGLWVPERELGRRHNRTKRHLADGLVEVPGKRKGEVKVIALEVELTQKLSPERLRIMSGLCECADYDEIHFLCEKKAKTEVIHGKEAVERNGISVAHLKVFDLDDVAGIA